MSRIYQGGSADRRFQSNVESVAYNPEQVQGREKQIRQEGQAAMDDLATQDRERKRGEDLENTERRMQDAADNLDLKILQQEQAAKFKQQQTLQTFDLARNQLVEGNELKLNQMRDAAILKNKQTGESQALSYQQLTAQNQQKLDFLEENQGLARERAYTQAQAQVDRAWMSARHAADNAALASQKAGVNALLSFADIGLKAAGMAAQIKQQKKEEQDALDFFGSDGAKIIRSDGSVNPIVAADNAAPYEISAGETGVQAVAKRDNLTGVEADAVRRPQAQLNNERSIRHITVAEAATQIAPVLNDSWAQGVRVQLSSGEVLDPTTIDNAMDAQRWAKAVVGDFVTASGLKNMDAAAVAKTLFPSAVNSVASFTNNKGAQIAANNIQLSKDIAVEKAATMLSTGTASLQDVWNNLSAEMFASGGFNGNRAGANEAALKKLIPYLSVQQLEELKTVNKIPGQAGTKLGTQYGPLIDDAIRNERSGDVRDRQLSYTEQSLNVKDLQAQHTQAILNAKSPEEIQQAHASYESALLNNGSPTALEEYQRQKGISNNYNPLALGQVIDDAAQGTQITVQQANQMLDDGVWNQKDYKAAQAAGAISGIADQAAIKSVQPDVKAMVQGAVVNIAEDVDTGIPTGDKVADRELAPIINDLIGQANVALTGFVQANPDAGDGAKRQFVKDWVAANVPGRLKDIAWNEETGTIDNYMFSGAAPGNKTKAATTTYKNPVTGQSSRVLTGLTTTQLKTLQTDKSTANDISPVNDRLLSKKEMVETVKALQTGRAVPARVKAIADTIGLTPKSLAIYQGMGQGVDVAGMIDAADKQRVAGGPGPSDMASGAKYLQTVGFPAKGAAYLAANIQQESSWNGMRSWPQVMNDGTSRNGGLVSWASWSDDPARLGKIEAYLGKPIEQATHAEQIAAIQWEMKTSYPNAYRIFMNPQSTDAQLRRASKEYWGWGHEGVNRFGSYLTSSKRAVGL